MKNIYKNFLVLFIIFVGVVGCQLEELPNENAPTLGSFDNASQADIQALAVGLEAVIRNDLDFHYETVSYLAREYYDLSGTDPRYTGELLKGPLDNNGFLTTRAFAAWYRTVKAANVLIGAVDKTSAPLSAEVKNSYYGFAKTMKAYSFLMLLNRQYTNGIRVDVADPDNLGPFIGYDEALIAIDNLLNEARSELLASPDEFDFSISSGFDDLRKPDTDNPGTLAPLSPADFNEFNRAIAARVALYQEDYPKVLNLLNDSFFDTMKGMSVGVAHVFGLTGNDIVNALFYVPEQSGQEFMIHNSWIADAEPGDARVSSKSILLDESATFDDLSATHQIAVYDSNVDPVYLIRNEELILMYAEANIGTNNTEALNAINIVRGAASLPALTSPVDIDVNDNTALLERVLIERRYSLLGEGHRWVDLRRLDRLNPTYVPLDRAGDNIIEAFPTPFSENVN